MRYIPNTPQDIGEMLQVIGVDSIAELFQQIPEVGRLGRPLDLPEPLCEPDLVAHMKELADKNLLPSIPSFLGAGVYAHIAPTAVEQAREPVWSKAHHAEVWTDTQHIMSHKGGAKKLDGHWQADRWPRHQDRSPNCLRSRGATPCSWLRPLHPW